MTFKTRTYFVIAFMLVFIISGVLSFALSTDLSFINRATIIEKIFVCCLTIFFLWILCTAMMGVINISENIYD